jgi:hypothetical protein
MKELALAGAIFIGLSLGAAVAQNQPSPPATFIGSVKVDGQNVADGTPVTALVGDKVCGEVSGDAGQKGTWTASDDEPDYGIRAGDSMYVVDVFADAQVPGCGREGATVTFKIGDRTAQQVGLWRAFPSHLSLTAGAAGTPTEQLTPATPNNSQTPTAPAAENKQSDSGFDWWWPAMGGGAVLVAGAALAAVWRARRPDGD